MRKAVPGDFEWREVQAPKDRHSQLSLRTIWRLLSTNRFRNDVVMLTRNLSSPLLDRMMHPTGSVSVWLVGRAIAAKGGPGFVLEGFQLTSLADYLRFQAAVRESLDLRFNEYLNELPPPQRSQGAAGLWKNVEVLQLVLAPRTIPTREHLAGLKKLDSRVDIHRVIANSDKADTRSSFTVIMRVAWDEEHFTKAEFRDGRLVKIASA